MAKFLFNLQSFLSLKEKLEEQKKLEYGRALSDLELQKQKKAKLVLEKKVHITAFRKQIETKISPETFRSYNDYIDLLKKKIIEQEKAIEKARIFAERKRLELVESMKERKMLDTLKENRHVTFLREEQIAEQKLVDELVSYRFNNQKA